MVRPKKPITDKSLKNWLENSFKNQGTKRAYTAALRAFKKNLGIDDLSEYLQSGPDANNDLRRFLSSLDGRPSKTISAYVTPVRVFFMDHNVNIDSNGWQKLKRRGFYPKRVQAVTRDRKPTKAMLKKILNYADIKGRTLFLFLLSSGARIGETLQLEIEDFDLEADPPKVHIRGEYTKGGVGERTTYFSYEARDALKDWLRIKDTMGKRDGKGTYESPLMFPFSDTTASLMWNRSCDKSGLGDKDNRTGRRIYHLHSLRKFFRTKIGLDLDMTHALMGHTEYLDNAYLRLDEEGEIAQAYLEVMSNVSVYQVEEIALRKAVEPIQEELEALKKKYTRLESMYEAAATLYKQLDRKELEKTIKEIYQKVKAEA